MLPEPFGLVGLEAARLGVPSVAFDVGGISEWLVHSENGVLVRATALTPRAFAQGIMSALAMIRAGHDLGGRARMLQSRFTLEAHLNGLLDVLEAARGMASR
jgi:glycosyltransferase involved in cell wall biosynthesis